MVSFRGDDDIQSLLAYGGATRGNPISKQRISKWLVETIKCAIAANDVDVQQGIKGHQTRKQVVSIGEMTGVDPKLICDAATWASSSTFAKYYRLNLMAEARSDFGRRILKLAGSSGRRAGTGSLLGYRIPKKKSGHSK